MTAMGGSFNADISASDKVQLRGIRKRKIELLDEIEQIRNELKQVDTELESMHYFDDSGKAKTNLLASGRKRFNKDPFNGIIYLTERGLIENNPKSIAEWIYETEGLSKNSIGDYLGSHEAEHVQVLEHYTKCFDFSGMFLVDAIRLFLKSFRLPGESQKIDRLMDVFSRHYVLGNPNVFPSADGCHSIAFSCIMLNTLLYNPNIKDRITLEGYVKMCKEYLDQKLTTVEMLSNIYDSVKAAEFVNPQEEKGIAEIHINAEREGWLHKQSSGQFMAGPLSWKKRWFVLSDQCLYYFEQMNDREPRGIIPLQNVGIRRVEAASRPHMFEVFSLSEERIKACKTEQDGKMVQGRHNVYRICAMNQEDLKELVHPLHHYRWLDGVQPFNRKISQLPSAPAKEFEEFDPFRDLEGNNETKCSSCHCVIAGDGRDALVAHYRSPWHKHNARRIQQGRRVLNEEEFEDAGEEDEMSDLSSSDSDDDDQLASLGSSRLFFVQNESVFSLFRAILLPGEVALSSALFTRPLDAAFFLLAGGHFAAAIFQGDTISVHKTIHRYTVRAKQGGAQSANDSAKGAAHSAGAALRRYNERTLRSEIEQLLVSWSAELSHTPLVFIRCASYQKSIFHGDGGLSKDDPRLRTVPFETRRPSIDEIKRVWQRLTTVTEHGKCDAYLKELTQRREANKQKTNLQRKKKEYILEVVDSESDDNSKDVRVKGTDHKKQPEPVKEEEDRWPSLSREFRQQLYDYIRMEAIDDLKSAAEHGELSQEVRAYLNECRFSPDGSSFLHMTATRGLCNVLSYLLNLGCDPGVKNLENSVPYVVSANKIVKKVFVQFRADNPKNWQWTRCQIPEPVEMTEEQLAKEAEKKKDKKNRQKEKIKIKKETEKFEKDQQAAKDAYLALPEREKRALAAEARLKAMSNSVTVARCVQCGNALPTVPFTYQDVNLCSPACVSAHRTKCSENNV